jgi:hypothetical protein
MTVPPRGVSYVGAGGGEHSGIAAGVERRNHKEGFFLRCIGDQEITEREKAQRLGCQLFAGKAHLREIYQLLNRFPEFIQNAVCRVEIVGGDKFPYFVDVAEGCGMEDKAAHLPRRSSLLRRKSPNASSPDNGLTEPDLIWS